jgi:hypothetical protein
MDEFCNRSQRIPLISLVGYAGRPCWARGPRSKQTGPDKDANLLRLSGPPASRHPPLDKDRSITEALWGPRNDTQIVSEWVWLVNEDYT